MTTSGTVQFVSFLQNLVLPLSFSFWNSHTVVFTLTLMKTGLPGLNASVATTNSISTVLQKVLLLKNSILLAPTAVPTIRTELINRITMTFCIYSPNMARKISAPKIKVSGLFRGKPRSELVDEAKQRRLEKIQKARDAAEARRQEATVQKAKKDADKAKRDAEKRLENRRRLEKQKEDKERQAKLVAARNRAAQTKSQSQASGEPSAASASAASAACPDETKSHAPTSSTADAPTLLIPKKKKVQKKGQHFPLKTQGAKAASAHKNQVLNDWEPDDMKAAIDQFAAQQLPDWPKDRPKLSIR